MQYDGNANANRYFSRFATFNDAQKGWYKFNISGTKFDGKFKMTGNSNASVAFDSGM